MENTFEVNGRTFEFRIPTPFDGCALADIQMSYRLPFGQETITGVVNKRDLTATKLKELQRLALKNCYEKLQGGSAPVVDENGEIGINGGTGPLLYMITARYLIFFAEYWASEFASLLPPVAQTTSPQNQ